VYIRQGRGGGGMALGRSIWAPLCASSNRRRCGWHQTSGATLSICLSGACHRSAFLAGETRCLPSLKSVEGWSQAGAHSCSLPGWVTQLQQSINSWGGCVQGMLRECSAAARARLRCRFLGIFPRKANIVPEDSSDLPWADEFEHATLGPIDIGLGGWPGHTQNTSIHESLNVSIIINPS
jgi:hypothetical protein